MLRLSEAQLAAYDPNTREMLAKQVLSHLKTRHPSLLTGLSRPAIARRVDYVVDEGWKLGLRSPRGHCILAALTFHSGPGLPLSNRFRAVLKRDKFPDTTITQLPSLLDDRDWDRIAAEARAAQPA